MQTLPVMHDAPTEPDDAVSRRAQARIGTLLRSKWRIDRVLGIGGMAAVYEGTHRNGKRGAIKMLHLELSVDPEARARFLREGYVANNVGHPGAVSVLDDDVADDGSVFVVMELLEGKTIEALAEQRPTGRLGISEAFRLIEQLLDTLAAAHDKGIVHRDLKPENLFLTKDGALKVLDFGLARMREMQSSAKMTKTGNAMGTPAFMPPEQALGEWNRVDARSDLWAVGASLFTLITGRLVHDAPTLNQLLLKAMTQPPAPIRTVMPGLPAEVAEVVDKALAFDMNARYQDARSMQAGVRKAIAWLDKHGEPQNLAPIASLATTSPGAVDSQIATLKRDPTAPSPADAAPRSLSRAALIAGALGTLVLGGALAFVVFGRGAEEIPTPAPVASSSAGSPRVEAPAPSASPSVAPVGPAREVNEDAGAPPPVPSVTPSATKKGPSVKSGADFGEWGK
ncbi:serine/threonine-protein kinase [Polyangium sp. 6x1]|uniref:serine/threonine-protein kinase n=1 Tax=Polyangium sp. 6x1 TaxID=3042689 RepID=UPI002482B444|nr:serine/threonine-protein kinase [Polyangium sp. 6x1]MDI1451509.1 serine/threonine-protein kinase [Polyangium sp. 6x1]